MNKFIDMTIKPVLVIGGLATALAGLDAFVPRFAVENVQKLEWVRGNKFSPVVLSIETVQCSP